MVVIASGETERHALPHLLAFLAGEGIEARDVRVSPLGRLDSAMVARLVRATWFELQGTERLPDKFVVLLDADGKEEAAVRRTIDPGGARLDVPILVAVAQWHLEAWFFAHAEALRSHLGRDLGHVDTSRPDDIASRSNISSNCWEACPIPGSPRAR